MQEPWKTDKWFSSPWSYLPEVRQKQAFGSHLKIHDVTLRDGERLVAGAFLGVNADGCLRLGTDAGEETILSGDVTLRRGTGN